MSKSTATAEKIDEQVDAPAQSSEEIPLKFKPVGRNRFQLASERENHYRVDVSVECTKEQVLDPSFWEHISQFLRPTDTITVIREDIGWKMVLFVRDAGHNWANVVEESFQDFGGSMTPQDQLPSRYKIDWAGTQNKWRVQFDGKPLKDGFASKELAHKFAANHALALKR